MSNPGEWGDHLTLQAAADAFNVRICVVSSFLENSIISIDSAQHQEEADQQQQQEEKLQAQLAPGRAYDERTLWLAFWAEVRCWQGRAGWVGHGMGQCSAVAAWLAVQPTDSSVPPADPAIFPLASSHITPPVQQQIG
ncbi:hypothetical protein COO60DRAFT_1270176 [Scenedesmus sp. NREL 46B-D3]|nr:hypothetical protein COO60DRAFT_1270176 [Scenedesmus sp. NREL 46B-D3]